MKTKQRKKLTRLKVVITLEPSDITYLKGIVKGGMRKTREVTRARILLMSHAKKSNREIIEALGCSPFMISSLRTRWLKREKDVKETIVDAPRSGQPRKLLPKHEACIVATSCTDAPAAHTHWTLEALKEKLLETHADLKTVSHESIRQVLLKNKLKPWREKNVVRTKTHPALS